MSKRTRITRHSALADWAGEHRDVIPADAVALIASHRQRAFDLLQEIDGSLTERRQLQDLAAGAAMESLLAMRLRSDPGLPDAIDRLLDVLPAGDPRHFEVALAVVPQRDDIAEPARCNRWLDRIDEVMGSDATWAALRTGTRHWATMRGGDLTLEETVAEGRRMLARLADLGDVDSGDVDPVAWDIAAVYLAQGEADLGNLATCHQLCSEGITRAQQQDRVYTERMWRNFDLQIAYIGSAPIDEVVADARTLQQLVAGHRKMWRTATSVLAGALAVRGDLDESKKLWAQVDSDLQSVPVPMRAFDLQHYPKLLLAQGLEAESARYWVALAADTEMPSFVVSILGSAARDAIFAGDLAFAVDCCRKIVTVELPSTLSFVEDSNTAFMIAAQCALRGDRVGAIRQIELAASSDRPEESLMNAAVMHCMTAIAERLLGDEPASRAAADRARAAFAAKGATALVPQVDRWVANADKLRGTSVE